MQFSGAIVLLALLAGIPDLHQAPPTIAKGQLVEAVPSSTIPGQRFTVYVPTSYDPARPAPVLYVMDPRGRARLAAKLFQPAAEAYGYIVMSSHNTSSDGPAELNLHAMQAMWDASHEWFAIDSRRVYVAGFSGTARVASYMAQNLAGSITGIIGSAAAYHPDVRPSRNSRFLYFGTVGDADYNFHEMESLERSLVALDLPHRVERFPGAHSWMPPDLAARAIEWMELRAMQAGSRVRDPELIEAWWTRDEEVARAALASGRHLDAARRFAAMARDFAGLHVTDAAARQAADLSSSAPARTDLKRRQAEARTAAERLRDVMAGIARAFPPGADAPARAADDLAQQLELARLKQLAGGTTSASLEARRRLNEIEVQLGFYLPVDALQAGEPARASYYLAVALDIDNRSPVTWYLRARTFAQLNATKDALAALRKAFESGFRDVALVEADSILQRLRVEPEYAGLLAQIRASGDVLDRLTVDRPPAHLIAAR